MAADAEGGWWFAVVEGSGDGVTVLRAIRDDTTIVDWVVVGANSRVREPWAGVVGDIVGARLSTLNEVADNSAAGGLYAAALEAGEPRRCDVMLSLPTGAGGWRSVIAVPVDADTVAVMSRDVTREKYFEHALDAERAPRGNRGAGRQAGTEPGAATESRFAKQAALALFVGAGAITTLNSVLTHPHGVNNAMLGATGVLTILAGLLLPLLPWQRYCRAIAGSLVLAVIAFLFASDHFDHYSRTPAAVAVYPVFFIIVIAWSGMVQRQGAAVLTALVAGPSLVAILAEGGHADTAWQCAIVTLPAAAVLGEVLSWAYRRALLLAKVEAEHRLRDPLTGAANRTALVEQLDHALARTRRGASCVAVLFIDLDRFKVVNDTLGHSVGDELLQEAASRITAAVREPDVVARIGGDEFVVVCEDLSGPVGATEVARRVSAALDEPFPCAGTSVHVTASVGVALSVDGTESSETLLRNADTAMYRAKETGRAHCELFDAEMQRWVASRLELEVALRQATARGELALVFQPVVSASRGAIVGFEALVRWDRPGYGRVSPAEFIGIAEDTGLILEIGEWVMREACRSAAAWRRAWPGHDLGVAVNISSRQVLKGDVVAVVAQALEDSGLEPALLTLELTESTLIDDPLSARDALDRLHDLGVQVALDDFGTGYSSLTYLRTLSFDVIKIDRSFVSTIVAERHDTAIVAAIVALARNLGIGVVAEGVETPEQLASLVYLGCDLFQGFLFSRPVDAEQVASLVEGWRPDQTGVAVADAVATR